MEERLEQIEKQLGTIRERNTRVEADKAWETSACRIGTICLITYLFAALLLHLIGNERIWMNALVPVLGFWLSSQSLPTIKKWWISAIYKKAE